jgi:prepilin-type N-terminal cleavage/methylation domain-containing protein
MNQRGFTLLELLVAMVLTLVVVVGILSFVRHDSIALDAQLGQTDVNDEARSIVDLMVREIRLAGFNPRCISPSPVTGVVSAGPQSLRIQYDLNENGVLDTTATASEDVTYQYITATQKLQRVVGAVTTDLATDIAPAGFALKYYDAALTEIVGTGGGGALTAAQCDAVRRVAIMLVPAKTATSRANETVSAPLWTDVMLRNRAYPCA